MNTSNIVTLPRLCRAAPRLLSCLASQQWTVSTLLSRASGTQLADFSTAPEASFDTQAVLHKLVNHEQQGVPSSAGTEGSNTFDLASMHKLVAALGDPQGHWSAVHIAGTKGKGSTAALLASILKQTQICSGLYTSPHIKSITERISTDGEQISQAEFAGLAGQDAAVMQQALEGAFGKLTHFEVLTALAFKHFQRKQVQLAVVETGLGGVTDATNLFEPAQLACAVITAIDNDHMEALGGSIEAIAEAKAGIMKPNRPVVIATQPYPNALEVLEQHAKQLNCQIIQPSDYIDLKHKETVQEGNNMVQTVTANPRGLSWMQPTDMRLHLLGRHQLDNAAAAIAAAHVIREQGLGKITQESVLQGLQATSLPGRMQVVEAPSRQGGNNNWLVLDGAHTAQSATALAETVRELFPERPLALIVAMADDKDHKAVMTALRGLRPAVVLFTSVDIAGSSQRSCSPGTLVAHWQAAGLARPKGQPRFRSRELIQASVAVAYQKAESELAAQQHAEGGVIVVCGSMHAVADAQRVLDL